MCFFEEYPEEEEILTFDKQGERGVAALCLDGLIAFVDYNSGITVRFGETWSCRKIRNKNGLSRNYFVWPIEKIDRSVKGEMIGPTFNTEEVREDVVLETAVSTVSATIDEDGITAMMNDTLFSKRFTAERYSAYRSINGAVLEIIPDSKGAIRCRENRISIDGLDQFLPFEEVSPLNYICKGERFLVKLEE